MPGAQPPPLAVRLNAFITDDQVLHLIACRASEGPRLALVENETSVP